MTGDQIAPALQQMIGGGGGDTTKPGGGTSDPHGFAIDTDRPILKEADGRFKTEYSMTERHPEINGGRWSNIPTIWDGKELSHREAMKRAVQEAKKGWVFPNFDTLEEATRAAPIRSRAIGPLRGLTERGRQ